MKTPTIKMLNIFKNIIKQGIKTATTRHKRCGNVDDNVIILFQDGTSLNARLTRIQQLTLKQIAANFYNVEGFEHPESFIKCWKNIYGQDSYNPETLVWINFFTLNGGKYGK